MLEAKKVPVFILAGGMGTRLSEETHARPKPMVEIGGIPILVHLMRSYYAHGFNDFVICAGYRAWDIKEYFLNYPYRLNHLVIDHRDRPNTTAQIVGKNETQEAWRVRVIDTGLKAMTGARIARAFDAVAAESFEHFAVTYGDGLCDVDLKAQLDFHGKHGRMGTILGTSLVSRFGELTCEKDGTVEGFVEKPEFSEEMINGGFMFFKRDARRYLSPADDCIFERKPLEAIVRDRQLMLFRHKGFWQCMDTLRDKEHLQNLWDKGEAPWTRR